jgi:tetratricopeptide (TPR) repeat protein
MNLNKNIKEVEAKLAFDKGVNLLNSKDYDNAEIQFLDSLKLVPNRASVIYNLTHIYYRSKNIKKLETLIDQCIEIKNTKEIKLATAYLEYFNGRYKESANIAESLINYLSLKKEDDQILFLLALNYKCLGNYLKTLNIYRKIIFRNREDDAILENIGFFFLEQGKIKKAYRYFKKGHDINPTEDNILWNISMCQFKVGDLYNGFKSFEKRWDISAADRKKFTSIRSVRDINEIYNKKILVWDEQGLGDTIQFSRFVLEVLKYTKNVTLVVNKKLKNLLSFLSKDILVEEYDSIKDDNHFDFQIPICSLPMLLGIKKKSDILYSKLDIQDNNLNIDNSIFSKDKLNIGFAISGNPNYRFDKFRSIDFKDFENFLAIDKINFFKLSANIKQQDLLRFYSYKIHDLGHKDFYELSFYLKKLDLVVSVDTSIIHLCGVLNIPSILLLSFNSDWRWFDDEISTVWYPSVKIIKQKKINNWQFVFDNLFKNIQDIYYKKFNKPFF